jgi:hypothetical protein
MWAFIVAIIVFGLTLVISILVVFRYGMSDNQSLPPSTAAKNNVHCRNADRIRYRRIALGAAARMVMRWLAFGRITDRKEMHWGKRKLKRDG